MAKKTSMVFGVIFIIAGIWGFFQSPILGAFAADTISSIVHLIVGIVLLALAGKASAGCALKTVGILYIVFAILGFIWGSVIGIFATNSGANWLYLVLGVIIAVVAFSGKKDSMSAPQM